MKRLFPITPYQVFLLVRVGGLLFRPAVLWLCLHFARNEIAYELSIVYLVMGTFFVLLNSDAHLPYYRDQFSSQETTAGSQLSKSASHYINDSIIHLTLFSTIIFGLVSAKLRNPLIGILFAAAFISEKIFDEVFRYSLFSKNYVSWSIMFLIKTVIPLTAAILCREYMHLPVNVGYTTALILCCLAACKPSIPNSFSRRLLLRRKGSLFRRVPRYKSEYFKKHLISQIYAFVGANVLYADKWLSTFLELKTLLPELTLATQFSNGILVILDNFHISTRRKQFIKNARRLKELTEWGRAGAIVSFGFGLYAIAVSVLFFFSTFHILTFIDLMIIGVSYFFYAFSVPLSEYCFWQAPRIYLLAVDLFFFSLIGLAALFFKGQVTAPTIPLIFCPIMALRTLALASLAKRNIDQKQLLRHLQKGMT